MNLLIDVDTSKLHRGRNIEGIDELIRAYRSMNVDVNRILMNIDEYDELVGQVAGTDNYLRDKAIEVGVFYVNNVPCFRRFA